MGYFINMSIIIAGNLYRHERSRKARVGSILGLWMERKYVIFDNAEPKNHSNFLWKKVLFFYSLWALVFEGELVFHKYRGLESC